MFILTSGYLGGELKNFELTLDVFELVVVFFLNFIFIYFSLTLAGFFYRSKNIVISTEYKWGFDFKRISCTILFMNFLNVIHVLYTGAGVVLSTSSSPISFIFSVFDFSFIILIYYFFYRRQSGLLFICVILSYLVLETVKGWTGHFLLFFFLELHFFYTRKNIYNKFKCNRVLNVFFASLFIIFFGAFVYMYMNPIKYEIRGVNYAQQSYSTSLQTFTDRLNYFPIAVGAIQKVDEVKEIHLNYNKPLQEFFVFLKPITPSFFFDKSAFPGLNNDVMKAHYSLLGTNTSADFGFLQYISILFYVDFFDFILFVLISISLFFLIVLFLNSSVNKIENHSRFFFFYIHAFTFMYSTSLFVVFADFIRTLIYLIPLLVLIGAMKIYKVNNV